LTHYPTKIVLTRKNRLSIVKTAQVVSYQKNWIIVGQLLWNKIWDEFAKEHKTFMIAIFPLPVPHLTARDSVD
jgi:hypothetical protein